MNKKEKLAIMKNRLNSLESSPKNIKCGGVVKALRREIKNMEIQVKEFNKNDLTE